MILLICIACSIWSRIKDIKAIYLGMIFLQVQILVSMFENANILQDNKNL